jgi:four helix bundle protein
MAFDFEKIDVYRHALFAIDQSTAIIQKMPRGNHHLSDQLKRAISSVALNISEGVGEFKPKEKARFYRMALRSASESCSIIQIGQRLGAVSEGDYRESYDLLEKISMMLTKLIRSMEQRPS